LEQKAQNMHDGNPANFQSLSAIHEPRSAGIRKSQADMHTKSRLSMDFSHLKTQANRKSTGSVDFKKPAKPPHPSQAKKATVPAKKPVKLL
jgi:hypothetical protein